MTLTNKNIGDDMSNFNKTITIKEEKIKGGTRTTKTTVFERKSIVNLPEVSSGELDLTKITLVTISLLVLLFILN
jgi:hypothetical protein